jgi:hypothetical protein
MGVGWPCGADCRQLMHSYCCWECCAWCRLGLAGVLGVPSAHLLPWGAVATALRQAAGDVAWLLHGTCCLHSMLA